MLGPVFEELGEELKEDAKFLKVNIDESLEIAQKFQVSSVPTMLVFKDGVPVDQMIGFAPKEKIELKVKSHL
jgi:thioredoxin 1